MLNGRQCIGYFSTTMDYPATNVNCAEDEKLWSRTEVGKLQLIGQI